LKTSRVAADFNMVIDLKLKAGLAKRSVIGDASGTNP